MSSLDAFTHIPQADKDRAVAGFVALNPRQAGIDFDTMMENLLDTDAHLPFIGDVVIGPTEAAALVALLGRSAP